MIDQLKNVCFGALHGFKGYPKIIRGRTFRLDASLRRFNFNGEQAVRETIESRLGVGGFFIDVGANFGSHSLLASDIVGESGRVFAVEPVPANLRLLHKNLKLNRFTNRCTVFPNALTDGSTSDVEITIEPGLSLVASLAPNFAGRKIVVPATTLDDILAGHEQAPDLIKIDVEGAEHEVLKGARNTLRKGPPLLVEVHRFALPNFNSSAELLASYLAEFGYHESILGETKGHLGDYHHSLFTRA